MLGEMLKHFVGPVHDYWDTLLNDVEFGINDSWQEHIMGQTKQQVYLVLVFVK